MHPDERELLLYLEDKASQTDRGRIEAHLGQCEKCSNLFADLFRLSRIVEQPAPFDVSEAVLKQATDIVARGKSRNWLSLTFLTPPFRIAVAGAAVVAIVLTTYLLVPREEPAQFRSDKVEETPALEFYPRDGTVVTEKTPEFRWNSIGESAAYRFSLLDEAAAVIWVNDCRDTSLNLPPSVVLQPGKTYLWRVESFLADKALERSALHAFTYVPSP